MREEIFLGNGAIALGLLEAGCQFVTSYPGTPSSEILPEVIRLVRSEGLHTYVEWSTNEKVAFDNAFAAAMVGKRAACAMKQVGLNVAADSLMSAAYLGTVGGFVVISCDDPGPHSSQTEQDTRLMARFAKVPVFDPSTPQEAREMVRSAMEISERFRIPVILRPAIRVCHARQGLTWDRLVDREQKAEFTKDPARWAATPKFRLLLHGALNKKLAEIGKAFASLTPFNRILPGEGHTHRLGIITGGVSFAVLQDILKEEGREEIPILKIGTPFPFPEDLALPFMAACDKVLVVEETDTVLEYLLRDRNKVLGRLSGHVPSQGELVPEVIHAVLDRAFRESGLTPLTQRGGAEAADLVKGLGLPVRKPTLCPGCPHRAAFFAIRKVQPKAIFASDIGCYTLGLNLGAVDTCLDMGAGITMASGLYHAFSQDGKTQPIVATIGDSTFFHSGTAGLINAVYNDARFILVILDNQITAMTGMQPTPGLGIRADGSAGKRVSLEEVVTGCGVKFLEVVDPYDLRALEASLKRAWGHVTDPAGGIAVVISRHPCVIAYRKEAAAQRKTVVVTADCDACRFCLDRFECPALKEDPTLKRTTIDPLLCTGCGVCISVCPKGAIVEEA